MIDEHIHIVNGKHMRHPPKLEGRWVVTSFLTNRGIVDVKHERHEDVLLTKIDGRNVAIHCYYMKPVFDEDSYVGRIDLTKT